MPFFTIQEGLTIQIPTLNTTGWEQTLREECFIKISEHDHTGNGRGNQLTTASFLDDSITDIKILIRNDSPLRALLSDNSTPTEILRVNSDDELVIQPFGTSAIKAEGTLALVNNQATFINTGIAALAGETYHVEYSLEREGTENLYEKGVVTCLAIDGAYAIGQAYETFKDSGVEFDVSAAGELQYKTTDNSDTSATMTYLIRRD